MPDDSSSGGIELDTSLLDDPASALRRALAAGDEPKAVGAFRLLAASGGKVVLTLPEALLLGSFLEKAGLFLDAARVYHTGTERDLRHADAPEALFRSACLLLGPAHRQEIGADILRYLVDNYPQHTRKKDAESILRLWEARDRAALARVLQEHGVEAPRPVEVASESIAPPPGSLATPTDLRGRLAARFEPVRLRRITRVISVLFVAAVAGYCISLMFRGTFKSIDEPRPEVLRTPVQKDYGKGDIPEQVVHLTKNGFNLTLYPVARYTLSGLIVSKNDYKILGLSWGEIFLMDLCVIWGETVRSRGYRAPGLKILQAGTVCYFQTRGPTTLRLDELSNNHIVITDPTLEHALKNLEAGDQVTLEGELVNVSAVPVHAHDLAGTAKMELKTSTTRGDTGNGACEIFYVKGLDILAPGHPIAQFFSGISFFGMLLFGLLLVVRVVLLPIGRYQTKSSAMPSAS